MNILNILSDNFRRGSRTRRPDDRVQAPEGLRASLVHETHLCVGCRSCAYVCSPAAITLPEPRDPADAQRGLAATWRYFAGQCTFCGRCVDYCPTGALRFSPEPPPVTGDQSEHRVEHPVEYRPCSRCGKPVIPLPGTVLMRLYRDPAPSDIAAVMHLCEHCRSRVTSERLKNTRIKRGNG